MVEETGIGLSVLWGKGGCGPVGACVAISITGWDGVP